MRWVALVVAVSTVAAAAVYFIRATEAGPPSQTADSILKPQVDGRLLDLIMGEKLDGSGYSMLCEFDAWVEIKDGLVVSVRENVFGSPLTQSIGLAVEKGERVEATGFEIPPGTAGWEAGASVARVYRDQAGNLQGGCAPESVVTEDDRPPGGPPLATPPSVPR
jgi:hypothetical protein